MYIGKTVEGDLFMTQLPNDQHITYQLQYRKCGKVSCSTCRNGQGHGPYWYAYWRDGSRLRSGYIGKNRPTPLVQNSPMTATIPAVPAALDAGQVESGHIPALA